jgi:DNA-binding SARP family transcriptional activator
MDSNGDAARRFGHMSVPGGHVSGRRAPAQGPASERRSSRWRLHLLQAFELVRGDTPLQLPTAAQRLVALLAMLDRPADRLYVAGVLWPESSERLAGGSLRTALWSLRRAAPGLVLMIGRRLALTPALEVDYHAVIERTHRLVTGDTVGVEAPVDSAELTDQLLPDWYEDWLAADRERLRQLQLHALEALSKRLRGRAEFARAIEVAGMAVAAEPTRESARTELIKAHLAEGNVDEAIRQFESFRRVLEGELGVEPSRRLVGLFPANGVERTRTVTPR